MSSTSQLSWKSTFSNVPPLTKTVVTTMTVMTSLGFAFRFRDIAISDSETEGSTFLNSEDVLIPLVALVPVSAPYRFWTFATASFFERNVFMYAINTAIMIGCGKYLERSWGSREFFKFLALSSIGTMLGIYITCLFEYVIRDNDELLYETQAYGLTGVIAGFLIGFKQLVPDHLITLWGVLSIRAKSLPLLFTLSVVIGSYITQSQINLFMALYGLSISWIYSRFFRVQDGIRGDRSEAFSFASFFPEIIQPPVRAISNFFFGILVKLHICSPTGYGGSFHYDLENPQMSGMGHTFTRPGSLRAEAERRRALALKALDMRLHAANSFSGIGRSAHSSPAAPVSLLSLSAEPLPGASGDDDDVLFEINALNMDDSKPPSRSQTLAGTEVKSEKEKQ